MDVTLPNGNVITDVPDNATKDQVREKAIAAGLASAADFSPKNTSDYRVEALRKGPAETAGLVSGINRLLQEQLPYGTVVSPFINPLTYAAAQLSGMAQGRQPKNTAAQSFAAGRQETYAPIMGALGTTGAEPQTGGQKIVAGGLQAVTDPLSYMFPPLAGVRRMSVPAQAVARPTEQLVVGMGAEGGGQVGEATGEKVGAPTAGRIIGGMLGGGATGYAAGSTLKLGPAAGKSWDFAKSKWDKLRGVEPKDEILREVDNRISNVFIAAGQADPTFLDTLQKAAKAQKSVSLKTPGGAEVNMPLSSLLADNPVVNQLIQSLASRDPVFRAQYYNQFESAKDALARNQSLMFGSPSDIIARVADKVAKGEKFIPGTDLTKVQAKRVRSLEEQIADAYNKQEVEPNVFGAQVEKLLATKEDSARKSTAPLYKEAFNIAGEKNVKLPANAVDDIYTFVTNERNSGIFDKFPTLYGLIENRFRPKKVEASALLSAEGTPLTPATQAFSDVGPDVLDSLKRRINADLRTTNNTDQIRFLTMLKDKVSGHIDQLDPDFVKAYRNADNAYLERVGLPFNSETLKSVDRKKFVEQIAPAIIGNKSNVDDFIRATGEDGIKVARDAFYDSFTKSAVKNDVLDPKAANKWLAKNGNKMTQIPGLEDELRASVGNVQTLLDKRAALDADFRRVTGNQLISKEGFNTPQELVNKMYGDINFTNKFMSNSGYGQNKDAVNAVRSFMLDDIVQSGDPVALLNDRNKAAIFNRVFGPTYAQKVADFAEVSNRLQKDLTAVSFRVETVPKTPIEEAIGIPPEQIISRFQNPVSGVRYAVTSLLSKYWANQTAKATEAKLKELLLNPSDAVKLFGAVKAQNKSLDPDKAKEILNIGKKYGIQWVQDATNDFMTGAARGAQQNAVPPVQEQPQE
jgi:hypothetical protein